MAIYTGNDDLLTEAPTTRRSSLSFSFFIAVNRYLLLPSRMSALVAVVTVRRPKRKCNVDETTEIHAIRICKSNEEDNARSKLLKSTTFFFFPKVIKLLKNPEQAQRRKTKPQWMASP